MVGKKQAFLHTTNLISISDTVMHLNYIPEERRLSQVWMSKSKMPRPLHDFCAAAGQQALYIFGGFSRSGDHLEESIDNYVYYESNKYWQKYVGNSSANGGKCIEAFSTNQNSIPGFIVIKEKGSLAVEFFGKSYPIKTPQDLTMIKFAAKITTGIVIGSTNKLYFLDFKQLFQGPQRIENHQLASLKGQ